MTRQGSNCWREIGGLHATAQLRVIEHLRQIVDERAMYETAGEQIQMTAEERSEAMDIALTEVLHTVYSLHNQLGLSFDDFIQVLDAARGDVEAMKMAVEIPAGPAN